MKFILYTPDSEANVSYPSSKSRTYYYRYPHARHSSWLLMTIFQLVLLATIVGLCVASPVPVSGSTKKNFLNRLDRYLDNYGVARKSQLTVLIGYTWIASEIIPLKPVFPSDLDTTSSTIANVARLAIAPNTNLILHEHSPRNGLETVLKNLAALIEKLKVAGQLNYMYVFPSAIYFREMVPEGSTLAQAHAINEDLAKINIVYIPRTISIKRIHEHIKQYTAGTVDINRVTLIVELGRIEKETFHVAFIPKDLRIEYDFNPKDLPGARWDQLKALKRQRKIQTIIPQTFL